MPANDAHDATDGGDILVYDNPVWHGIKARVIAAFADVKLGDGIGYFEAVAIDDYLKPEDPLYQAERARDDRQDWMSIVRYSTTIGGDLSWSCHCFMDLQGLYFYLPASLLINHEWLNYSLLEPNTALLDLLTRLQWEVLIDFYAYHVDYDWSVAWHMNDTGTPCPSCGKINGRASMTRVDATVLVENGDDFRIWRMLRSAYQLRFGEAYPSPA